MGYAVDRLSDHVAASLLLSAAAAAPCGSAPALPLSGHVRRFDDAWRHGNASQVKRMTEGTILRCLAAGRLHHHFKFNIFELYMPEGRRLLHEHPHGAPS